MSDLRDQNTKPEKRVPWEIIEPGSEIASRYRIERVLGEGGMGVVYLAIDKLLSTHVANSYVALKVLKRDVCIDERHRKQFLQEVQLTRTITHPNIVRTFEVGEHEANLFYTMEYVAGAPLSAQLTGNPLDPVVAANVLAALAKGLQAIHMAGVIHRDMKPQNIIFSKKGEIKIADFGIAHLDTGAQDEETELIGSAFYMSPECWSNEELSPASDVYSFGVLAYEIVTGVLPFDGLATTEVMVKHLEQSPVEPLVLVPGTPAWLSELIMTMLAKNPVDRPTAEEVQRRIESNLTSSERRSLIPISDLQLRPAGVFPGEDGTPLDDSEQKSGGWTTVKDVLQAVETDARKRRWSVLGYQGGRQKLIAMEDPAQLQAVRRAVFIGLSCRVALSIFAVCAVLFAGFALIGTWQSVWATAAASAPWRFIAYSVALAATYTLIPTVVFSAPILIVSPLTRWFGVFVEMAMRIGVVLAVATAVTFYQSGGNLAFSVSTAAVRQIFSSSAEAAVAQTTRIALLAPEISLPRGTKSAKGIEITVNPEMKTEVALFALFLLAVSTLVARELLGSLKLMSMRIFALAIVLAAPAAFWALYVRSALLAGQNMGIATLKEWNVAGPGFYLLFLAAIAIVKVWPRIPAKRSETAPSTEP